MQSSQLRVEHLNKLFGIFLFLNIILFFERKEGKEKERETSVWLSLACPLLVTWPTTQACALTGNRTGDPWVRRLVLSPLSHASQGWNFSIWKICLFFHTMFIVCLPCPSPRTSHFFKEPWFLLLENGIRNCDLGAGCAWYYKNVHCF